jgi:hypothetical protein
LANGVRACAAVCCAAGSRTAWQAGEKLSFSVFGQNLLQNERLEYADALGSTASTLVKRGAYAKVKWIF